MRNDVLVGILMKLLSGDGVTAATLSKEYELSKRTIYRYIDVLGESGVPIISTVGADGGIKIMDSFVLDRTYFTKEEYLYLLNILKTVDLGIENDTAARIGDKLTAMASALAKEQAFVLDTNTLVIDGDSWQNSKGSRIKLTAFSEAVKGCEILHIEYTDSDYILSERDIEPHTVVLKEGVWYVYAYCLTRNDFRLFRLSRIGNFHRTQKNFERRHFDLKSAPWHKAPQDQKSMTLSMTFTAEAAAELEELFGITLPESGTLSTQAVYTKRLVSKLLSLGNHIKILSPTSLAQELRAEAQKILELY